MPEPLTNQTNRKSTKPKHQRPNKTNKTHVRTTDAEHAKIRANQLRSGHASMAAYMRSMALDGGSAKAEDRDFERIVMQAQTRIAGAIENASSGLVKEAALEEVKRIIEERL
jgi:hypothetical protein